MTAWIIGGVRVDIELAVALEVAKDRVVRADSRKDREEASDYNRRLWRLVGALAPVAPQDTASEMRSSAARIEQIMQDHEQIPHMNANIASRLARRCPPDGAIRSMMHEWHNYLTVAPNADFAGWLMDRLEGLTPNMRLAS